MLLTAIFVRFQSYCETQCQRRVLHPLPVRRSLCLLGDGDKFIQRIRISKEALLIDKDILWGEEIYVNQVPEDMVGKLFHYQVTGYDSRTKKLLLHTRTE